MNLSFSTENARYAFGEADRLVIETIPFKIAYQTEEGVVCLRDDTTAISQQFSHAQLSELGARGRLRVDRGYYDPNAAGMRLLKSTCNMSGLTGKALSRVTKADAYCEALLELHREGMIKFTDVSLGNKMNRLLIKGAAIEYAENLNRSGSDVLDTSEDFKKIPCPRTLRRWLAARREFGLVGLVDNMSKRGNRGHRMEPEALGLMMKEVRGYLSLEKPTIKLIQENVEVAFLERNEERAERGLTALIVPSRETVRRAIRALDPFQVELARKGKAAARKKYRPVTSGLNLTRPLQRVEIDEWTVDVMTIMESTGIYALLTEEEKLSLGLDKGKARWTLTAGICCTTRCIVGLVLSRNPGAEAATKLLEMIVSNKGKWADAVGALTAWDMHGTPELLVFDGGAAFKSQRFRFAAADIGVACEMAMNGVPENRGTIERVFGTFAKDFAPRLTGHTFNSIIEKGDADPEKRAGLSLDDFSFALIRWVVDIYHNTPHCGLDGETPVKCWRRLSKKYGVQSPPDMHTMRLAFGKARKMRLDKTGINILGVQYQSETLAEYMRRKDPRKVDVRWHPKDIGAVSVMLEGEWQEIPARDHTLEGVAAQTWLTSLRRVRAANPKSNRLDSEAVREAIKAIAARNEAAKAEASLNLEDWSEERMKKVEEELLAGVEFVERKTPTKAKGELGHEIPSVEDLTGEPMKKAPTAKAVSGGKASSAPQTTRKSNLTIEEE